MNFSILIFLGKPYGHNLLFSDLERQIRNQVKSALQSPDHLYPGIRLMSTL
jgi:hypothetical protein